MRCSAVIESPALCNCTDLTEVEVKGAIRDRNIPDADEARRTLGWPGSGCSVCRPVLNYFVTMFGARRRNIVFALHRRELEIGVVDMSDGDSGDLECLHDPLAHREEALKRHLHSLLVGLWTPAPTTVALGRDPDRNGRSPVTDAELRWGEQGWRVYVGGVSGDDFCTAAPLGCAGHEVDACGTVAALLQLYREEGHFNERLVAWRRRVGLDLIRRRVVEDAGSCHQLLARLEPALRRKSTADWKMSDAGESRSGEAVSALDCAAAGA